MAATPSQSVQAEKAKAAYNAASDHYDDTALSFWDYAGHRTIERLALSPGSRVLDVCCGAGASAIPAARAVGPGGSVLGVDLAENLLSLARAKAAAGGLRHTEFRCADMTALDLPESSFDAVVCVFGIFFAADMPGALAGLWRFVRSGGVLAITNWGPRWFEPACSIWWDAVAAERPDLRAKFNPWDRITEPDALRSLFHKAGIEGAHIEAEAHQHELRSPEDAWTIILGSGLRWTLDQLGADSAARVNVRVLREIRDRGIRRVEANVLYATTRR